MNANDDEQQPDRPPGMACPHCMFYIDCDMATGYIQAEMPITCPSCHLNLSELNLNDVFQSICSSTSNQ